MKKLISILLTLTMVAGLVATPVFAAPGRPGRPGSNGNNGGGNKNDEATSSSVNSKVEFYVNRWGDILDTNGSISGQNTSLFTGIVAESNTNTDLASDFAVAIGGDVTEDDILNYLETAPDDDAVFDKMREEYANATIYTSSKEVIEWADFTSENGYKMLWYVLKYQWSGAEYAWHIDGVVLDENDETVDLVLPEEKEEYEEYFEETKKDLLDEKNEEIESEEKSDEPETTEPETTEPETPAEPEVPAVEDTSISLKGVSYAYIFGYAPTVKKNDDGLQSVEIIMGMDDEVKVEQVCAMLMRLLDQAGRTSGKTYPMVPGAEIYKGAWYERGLLYMAEKGGFDGNETIHLRNASRGQVAKFVSCALDLNLTEETDFVDIDGNEYKEYIEKVYAYGYMEGKGNGCFDPDATLTRAEFCQLINNIIGRDESYILETQNGEAITASTYGFVDMDTNHWAYEACLRATSCFDENGYVDLASRKDNIRNKLDDYNGQIEY